VAGNGDNVEAELAAMRARQEAADQAEQIANAEKMARDAMKIQKEAKKGKK
jgi:hypothetical protein